MKKAAWLVVALAALGGLAVNSFADVQNIRLSGDIRLRGYFLSNAAADVFGVQDAVDDSFISQRTRVTVEADLEDHVLVVATLKAEALWGADDEPIRSGGAGSGQRDGAINRRFDVGVSEAYVQLNEVFYTPATLKLGRQYLHYGRGLILSSVEHEYNYDAARLVLDFYPMTIDVVYAKAVENTPFGPGDGSRDTDLVFVNGRYEMADAVIKNVELYFGYLANNNAAGSSSRVPPSAAGASPMIIGLRGDLEPTDELTAWVEGAFEFGSGGPGADDLAAWLANIGGRYTMKDVQWSPAINASYTFASGGGSGGENTFIPWFDYVEGYNGYLFAPALSNIHIFNLGASVKPYENTTLAVQAYYYMKADKDGGAGSNPNVDFGGLAFSPAGASRELGWEIDGILGYDYSKDVRAQLVYAAFIPDNDFQLAGSSRTAHEVRGEINVRF